MLVDSHCHIDFEVFRKDLPQVLQRAQDAGVGRIILAGCSARAEEREHALELCRQHPGQLFLVSGVHPHEADACREEDLSRIAELAGQGQLIGIGETGLDFFHDLSDRDRQRQLFRRFLRLARTVELPVVIHTRDADEDTLQILGEEGLPRRGGVVHCFSSGRKLGLAALELGLHLGISGMLTFPWAGELRAFVKEAPLEALLLETDSPYLSPAPARGKRNEPAAVRRIAERLAELKGISFEEVAEVTTENCRRLYRIE